MGTANEKRSRPLLIRRIIAIALMAISVACLFWPSMLTLKKEAKQELEERFLPEEDPEKKIEEKIEELYQYLEDENEYFRRAVGSDLPKLSIRKKDLTNQAKTAYGTVKDGALTADGLRKDLTAAAPLAEKAMDYFNKVIRLLKNKSAKMTYWEKDYASEYCEVTLNELNDVKEKYEKYVPYVKIASIAYNVLFFAVIGFAAIAIVLMSFNLINLNPIHTVFAFLCSGVFVAILVIGNFMLPEIEPEIPEKLFLPGVSMILMPLLSLAACIVYKRDKTKKAKPAAAASVPQQTNAPRSYMQQPAVRPMTNAAPKPVQTAGKPDWTCRNCGSNNPARNAFCGCCGSQKPEEAPASGTMFCTECGSRLNPGTKFCPICGTQQNE